MREIRFRAKRKDTGEWLYWNLLDGFSYPKEIIDEDTVGQYTGLKDKNGKEIYEGDILVDTASDGNGGEIPYTKSIVIFTRN